MRDRLFRAQAVRVVLICDIHPAFAHRGKLPPGLPGEAPAIVARRVANSIILNSLCVVIRKLILPCAVIGIQPRPLEQQRRSRRVFVICPADEVAAFVIYIHHRQVLHLIIHARELVCSIVMVGIQER